jgi:hypothetical protein
MKRTLLAAMAALLTVTGCKTTEPNASLQVTIAIMDQTVPISVAIAVLHDPSCANDLRNAANVIEACAADPAVTPGMVLANLTSVGLDQEAQLAVLGGVALWQAYVAQHPEALDDTKLLLTALVRDIRAGLPPATPDSLRGYKAKRR